MLRDENYVKSVNKNSDRRMKERLARFKRKDLKSRTGGFGSTQPETFQQIQMAKTQQILSKTGKFNDLGNEPTDFKKRDQILKQIEIYRERNKQKKLD